MRHRSLVKRLVSRIGFFESAVTVATLLPFNDTMEAGQAGNSGNYTQGQLPNTWGQIDNSVGGHNTATIAANPSTPLDSTGSNCLSQGNARQQVLWAQRTDFPNGIVFPADCLTYGLTDGGGSSTIVTSGTGVLARGSGFGSLATASFYFAGVIYHGGLTLFSFVNGMLTALNGGVGCSAPFLAGGTPMRPMLLCHGTTISAGLYVPSTNKYLQNDGSGNGSWVSSTTPIYAITITDTSITGSGFCGFFNSGEAGGSFYDDFHVEQNDLTPPLLHFDISQHELDNDVEWGRAFHAVGDGDG